MSEAIENFLNDLKDWRKKFSIEDYNYDSYNCEIADIAKMQVEKNTKGLVEFWRKKCENKYFEIKHPIYNNITLRAVHSIYNNFLHNCVFFVDKDNKHILLWIQFSHLINCFLIQDRFFRVMEPWGDNATLSAVEMLKNHIINSTSASSLQFKDVHWAFTLKHFRPFHFFMDILPGFYQLNGLKPVENISLFKPKNAEKIESGVFFFPATIPLDSQLIDNMKQNIYKDSQEKHFTIDEPLKSYDLVLWLGLPGEKRSWIEQVDGIWSIVKQLSSYFPKIKIYFDGMTASDSSKEEFLENNKLYLKVKKQLSSLNSENFVCDIVSLVGYDYRTKIYYCSKVDVTISDIGTTSLVPFEICQKPGIGVYGGNHVDWLVARFKSSNSLFYPIDKKFTAIPFDEKGVKDKASYHVSWEHVFNLVAECLEKVKNIEISKILTPDIKILTTRYKMMKEFGVNISQKDSLLCNFLEDKIALFQENKIESEKLKFNELQHINKDLNNCLEKIKANNNQLKLEINKIDFMYNFIKDYGAAKARIQNQLSYKLGQAIIINSKSILGYIRMPFVLSYIKDKHKQEQKIYQEKIKNNPSLALPPLESYPDYKEALKEKECLTYKLGEALVKADKTWYKGGYIKLIYEIKKIKLENKNKKEKK
ncbi:hypothetical protein UPTC5105_00308 [Campylobacter lari]|uniref:hypothetical protein n=1 Tax=Campylobacter lari TaxID=201 RepID=UPI002153A55E|nr:hypothetical protein [Campylobacter lari]MCR6530790.1 hypothetical protein [Campylobacter lari]